MKNQKRGYFNLDVAYKRAAERLSTLEPTLVAERAGIQFNRANATFSGVSNFVSPGRSLAP